MPTDNNVQLELVNQRTRLNVSNVLMSVTITTFLVTGFTMMYSTAFDREFSVWAVMMFALIASLIFTVLYNINKKWLTAIIVVISCRIRLFRYIRCAERLNGIPLQCADEFLLLDPGSI